MTRANQPRSAGHVGRGLPRSSLTAALPLEPRHHMLEHPLDAFPVKNYWIVPTGHKTRSDLLYEPGVCSRIVELEASLPRCGLKEINDLKLLSVPSIRFMPPPPRMTLDLDALPWAERLGFSVASLW